MRYAYAVWIDKQNENRFRDTLNDLGFRWDEYDEQERYDYIVFSFTEEQFSVIERYSDILDVANEIEELY